MREKTYTLAGTSRFDGELTYRFANGKLGTRVATLKRNGHSDVSFYELPSPMVLRDAVAWLQQRGIMAVLPTGQRRTGDDDADQPERALDADAHVRCHMEWQAKEADRRNEFVARMRAAREAKRSRQDRSGS
jgi:hypothetical protein